MTETVDFEDVWPDLYSIYLFTKSDIEAMHHHLKQKFQLDKESCVRLTEAAIDRIENRNIKHG